MLLLIISINNSSEWYHYIIVMCSISLALIGSKLPFITIFKEMKLFIVMITVALVMTRWHLACRLILMLMVSTVMVGTTPLPTIKHTIEWYLRPIPFIPEVQIATIINLTFVLLPGIFDSYAEMMNAGKARCIELRKNPVKRIKFIAFPLLTRSLRRADALVNAMESRCYSEIRTQAIFKTNKVDWVMLTVCVVISIAAVL